MGSARRLSRDESPVEGVLDWLFPSVYTWIFGQIALQDVAYGRSFIPSDRVEWACRRLRIADASTEQDLESALEDDVRYEAGELALDLVQIVLEDFLPRDPNGLDAVAELNQVLREANSVWHVATQTDEANSAVRRAWLERRDDEGLAELVDASAGQDRASEHLEEARRAILGRDPKADRAWDQAVKAVEVAARKVITPNDGQATLGRILGILKDQLSSWSVRPDPGLPEPLHERSGGAEAVELLGRLIWHNQPRHGDPESADDVLPDPEDAKISVFAAALLVYLFRSGAVRRREP